MKDFSEKMKDQLYFYVFSIKIKIFYFLTPKLHVDYLIYEFTLILII
jgi:hypothetical protein